MRDDDQEQVERASRMYVGRTSTAYAVSSRLMSNQLRMPSNSRPPTSPITEKTTRLFIVTRVGTRLMRASISVDTVAAATAGPGPSRAMIVVCTSRPAESRIRRAATEAASAATSAAVRASTSGTGCQSSGLDTTTVAAKTIARMTARIAMPRVAASP